MKCGKGKLGMTTYSIKGSANGYSEQDYCADQADAQEDCFNH